MKRDALLEQLAEIAVRATAVHRAMNGLEPADAAAALDHLRELAASDEPADGTHGAGQAAPPSMSSAAPSLTLPDLIARWHRAVAALGAPSAQRRRELADLEWLETTIARTPARGDDDLIAKADLLRQLVDGDPEQSQSARDLAASLADDIERVLARAPDHLRSG